VSVNGMALNWALAFPYFLNTFVVCQTCATDGTGPR
jgi:hypothetical protein